MGKFPCALDGTAENFCLSIARRMMKFFAISEDEAVGRINEYWENKKIVGANLVYHREAEDWAKIIYYEESTWYWVEKWMKENTPKSRLYPKRQS
jgi:hypothetical protein